MVLRVENLSLHRGTRVLQKALDFETRSGEALWVRGPNGVGKSTLLETLCGFRPHMDGAIYWQDRSIENDFDLYHDAIEYIGHKNGNNENLTTKAAIEFYADLYNSAQTESALETINLTNRKDIEVRYLSVGQQKRLALARLLLRDASLWILDEPSVSLDQDGVNWLTSLMETHIRGGGSIIYTSHVELKLKSKTLTLENMKKSELRNSDAFLNDEWESVL